MNLPLIRMISSIFWLLFGVVILLRHQLAPQWAATQDNSKLTLIAVFAIGLALFHFYRYRRVSRRFAQTYDRPNPLQPKPRNERTEEYIPELDFSAQYPDEKTP